jgi:hypothetical protein
VFCSLAASYTNPAEEQAPAHDAYTHLLRCLPPNSEATVEPGTRRVGQAVCLAYGAGQLALVEQASGCDAGHQLDLTGLNRW